MELGLQLYGCMSVFRENTDAFFEAVANMGYTQIEPCVAFGTSREKLQTAGVQPVWLPEEVPGFLDQMRKHGLKASSCHVFGDLMQHIDEMGSLAAENGLQEIVINFGAGGRDREAVTAFAARCAEGAAMLSERNIALWLHNGAAEIRGKIDGKTLYEFVLAACGGKLRAQVDVGWVQYGGEEPVSFLQRVQGDLASVHYKDLKPGYAALSQGEIAIALGDGVLNTKAIVEETMELPVTQIVDQDSSDGDFLADLASSAACLSALAL